MKLIKKLKNNSYEEAFVFIRKIMEKYRRIPRQTGIAQLALMLDAHRIFKKVKDSEKYDQFIIECYIRALESKSEDIRYRAAESLYKPLSEKRAV